MTDTELLKQAEAIQTQAVDYIAKVQPLLDAQEKRAAEFAKKAHQTVGALVERRIIAPQDANTVIDKLAADPSNALDLALALSRRIGVGSELGKAASTQYADSQLDPFQRLFLYGDSKASIAHFDGNVD